MKLTGEEARDVVYDDAEDWQQVEETTIDGHSRWSIQKSGVFRHIPTDTHYRFDWQVGATESQDELAYEYDDFYEPTKVELKEVVIKRWEDVQ